MPVRGLLSVPTGLPEAVVILGKAVLPMSLFSLLAERPSFVIHLLVRLCGHFPSVISLLALQVAVFLATLR